MDSLTPATAAKADATDALVRRYGADARAGCRAVERDDRHDARSSLGARLQARPGAGRRAREHDRRRPIGCHQFQHAVVVGASPSPTPPRRRCWPRSPVARSISSSARCSSPGSPTCRATSASRTPPRPSSRRCRGSRPSWSPRSMPRSPRRTPWSPPSRSACAPSISAPCATTRSSVAELLGLPSQAVVVFGLCVGYATEKGEGEVKPRLPQSAVLHKERYDASEGRRPCAPPTMPK